MELGKMSSADIQRAERESNIVNKRLNIKKAGEKQQMGKDSFIKLLITELKHQDPTQPKGDKEFIAQMAQFSSLEQMTNMNKEIKSMTRNSQASEAYSLLGKRIDAYDTATSKRTSGTVNSVKFSDDQAILMVGKEEVPLSNVHAVHAPEQTNSNSSKNEPNLNINLNKKTEASK